MRIGFQHIILVTLLSFVLSSSYAQYNAERVLDAYNYRDDIAPEIKEMVKNTWEKPGILHSNWIENQQGKSILLDGTVMFPDIEYTQLKQAYPSAYYISTGKGADMKKGMIGEDGGIIIPMEYELITQMIGDGNLIECIKAAEPSGDGKLYNHTIDLYDWKGKFITSIMYKDGKRYASLTPSIVYHRRRNLIEVKIYNSDNKKNTYTFYYPDGDVAFGPYETKEYCHIGTSESGWIRFGKKKTEEIPNYSPKSHPELDNETKLISLLSDDYVGNCWIRKASECFEQNRWDETLQHLNFFDAFDKPYLLIKCPEVFSFDLMWLRSKYELGELKSIYEQIKNGKLYDYSLSYNRQTQTVFTPFFSKYNSDESTKQVVQACKDIFDEAAASVLAEEKAIKKQRNAERWAIALGLMVGTVNQLLAKPANSSTSSSGGEANSGAAVSSYGSDTSVSTSSSSSSSSSHAKKTCRVCNGTGREVHETYMGSATAGKKKWCSDCGKEVYYGHSHKTCSLCHGSGMY